MKLTLFVENSCPEVIFMSFFENYNNERVTAIGDLQRNMIGHFLGLALVALNFNYGFRSVSHFLRNNSTDTFRLSYVNQRPP